VISGPSIAASQQQVNSAIVALAAVAAALCFILSRFWQPPKKR
jgi:hypothetical protein